MPELRDRQQAERAFYDARAAAAQARDLRIAGDLDSPIRGIGPSVLRTYCGISSASGMVVLDCGCGSGVSSVMWARHGARVCAFDVSPRQVELAQRRAEANGVADRVTVRVMPFENLCYPSECFDVVFGVLVLHHVNVRRAAEEAYRVLKPGGKAIFLETLDRNVLLRFARRCAGRCGIAKVGTSDEHPLRAADLSDLRSVFGGKLRLHNTGFCCFSLFDRNVLRYRLKPLSRLLRGMDLAIYRVLPRLRRYSYFGLLELVK